MKNLIRHIEIIATCPEGIPVITREGREVIIHAGATKDQIQSVLRRH